MKAEVTNPLKIAKRNQLKKLKIVKAAKIKNLKKTQNMNQENKNQNKPKVVFRIRRFLKKTPGKRPKRGKRFQKLKLFHYSKFNVKKSPELNSKTVLLKNVNDKTILKTSNKEMLYNLFLSFSLQDKNFLINEVNFVILKIILKKCEIFSEEMFNILLNKIFNKPKENQRKEKPDFVVSSKTLNRVREEFLSGAMSLDKSVQLLLKNFFYLLTHCSPKTGSFQKHFPSSQIESLLKKVKFLFESYSGQVDVPDLLNLENQLNMNLKEIYCNQARVQRLKYIHIFSHLHKNEDFRLIFNHFLTLLRNPSHGRGVFLILGKKIKRNIDHLESITRKMLSCGLSLADLEKNLTNLFQLKNIQEIESFIQIREAAETVQNKWFN